MSFSFLRLEMWAPLTSTAVLHTRRPPQSPAIQMHTDNKVANHGKQVSSDSRSQIPSVNQQAQQQGTAAHLGSKGVGPGSHGVKANQISMSNAGLKAAGQSVSSIGGMLKTKSKRERSVSIDSAESRNAIPSGLEADTKAGELFWCGTNCHHLSCIESYSCCSSAPNIKFTSFNFLSARSLSLPDCVH